jgi:hypothetical protein
VGDDNAWDNFAKSMKQSISHDLQNGLSPFPFKLALNFDLSLITRHFIHFFSLLTLAVSEKSTILHSDFLDSG